MRRSIPYLVFGFIICAAGVGSGQPLAIASPKDLGHIKRMTFHPVPHDLKNGQGHARFGISGINSIPNWNDHFFANGFDANGNANRQWYTNTAGNPPQQGGTTTIGAPLQAMNIELDDANGNQAFFLGNPLFSPATSLITPALDSPVFSSALYSSGPTPTQYGDAIQRAEFFNHPMKSDWHTLLNPSIPSALTLRISQPATCNGSFPFAGCAYAFIPNFDGTCCVAIFLEQTAFLNSFLEVALTDILGNVITTKDISTFLSPDTFLFSGDLTQCCILGFHTFLYDPATTPEDIWVVNYSSWVSSGIFGPDVSDVAVLSHEIAETFNDPFVGADGVHDLTPWWLSYGQCDDALEVGDPIEGLLDPTFPITLNGFTYHPFNVALVPWFEFQSPSSALGGAYSYPDTTLLTAPSPPQRANCL